MHQGLTVTLHSGPQGLQALRLQWQNLLPRLARPRYFHSWEWHDAWLNTLCGAPEGVVFAVAQAGGVCQAIIPLQPQPPAQLQARCWSLPEHSHIPLADALIAPGMDPHALLSALSVAMGAAGLHWDLLRLEPVMAESPLNGLADHRCLRAVVKTCDQLACNLPWDELAARFSANFRSNLNKARNRLAREADVSMDVARTPAELERHFPAFLEIEASGWKGAEGTAIANTAALVAFYRRLIECLGPSGQVRIYRLSVGGQTIAGQFCLLDADTLYVLKLGYDEQHSRLSPGNSLLERVIRLDDAERGYSHVNLVGNPPWFRSWNPESVDVYRLVIFNTTLRGRMLYTAARCRRWVFAKLRRTRTAPRTKN